IDEWIKKNSYESYFYSNNNTLTKKSFIEGKKRFIREKGHEFEQQIKECGEPSNWKELFKAFPEILHIEATKKVSEEISLGKTSKSIYKKIIERIILETIKGKEEVTIEIEKNIEKINNRLNKESDDTDNRFSIIKKLESEIKENLNKNIFINSIEIKFLIPSINDFFSNSKIYINDGIYSSIEDKGDGLKRSLIFALFLTYSKFLKEISHSNGSENHRPFVFLIEEPELFLHPQAQRKLAEVLNTISEFDQVLYSTHSSYFVNVENYLSLNIIEKKNIDEGTSCTRIEEEIYEPGSKKEFNLLMRCNIERNEMFFAKKVVLVEGSVEKIILNHTSSIIEKNFDELNISIIECGGKGNLKYFIKILSFFNKPIILIHDIDPLKFEEEEEIFKESKRNIDANNKNKKLEEKKRMFELNKEIREEIDKIPSKIGLITIDPSFEKLIGISEKKDSKPYKAQNIIKNLDKESIIDEIKEIIDFIIDFKVDSSRKELLYLEITAKN
ncbi:MAG: ATP-dependent nuclease, partial [Promethearchaeota archaeon]